MELSFLPDGMSSVVRLTCEGDITFQDFGPEDVNPFQRLVGEDVFSRRVLLGLERTSFIDSSGIGWLITSSKRFDEGGGTLVLHSVPPRVRQIFDFIRMGRIISIVDDEAEALAKASGGVQ
jgi:anti-anti-sigma factor